MFQILEENRKPTTAEKFNKGLQGGMSALMQEFGSYQQNQKQQKQNQAVKSLMGEYGEEIANLPPDLQKLYVDYALQGGLQQEKTAQELRKGDEKRDANRTMLRHMEIHYGLSPGSLEAYIDNPEMAARVAKPEKPKAAPGGLAGTPLNKKEAAAIEKVIKENPNASAEELEIAFNKEPDILPGRTSNILESRRRTAETKGKNTEDRRRALRQETLPLRTEIANKAKVAEQSIRNKEHLLDLIETGDINDPTYAAVAEALPLNLGKRLLSPKTVEYKGGLVEEYGDLRNIFSGATRVKEIDILEGKVADLYLTDQQKKAILRSRINALKADVIRAEAAAQLEDREDLGVLQFEQEVEKIAKQKLDSLFGQIIDDQKAIIESAERRQKSDLPLDPNDSDDKEILMQILEEAGGDKQEARKIAKKKGYKF